MNITVGFVGMTHLGLVSATGTASKGFPTLCVDHDAGLISRLQKGELPVVEPGLDDMLSNNGQEQSFSHNLTDLKKCDVVYIAPDVPTNDQGQSDLTDIYALINDVIPNLSNSAILVILCQVPPGFTRELPFDKKRLYYQVETLIFGRAVERATQPERFIVGCADPGISLPETYRSILEAFGCPLLLMRYESAELAKISINMCLVASIGVANTMAEICERTGAIWHEIVPSLRLDRRIGEYSYINPGLGIAGGNLERDLATIIRLSEIHNTDAGIVRAWLQNSRYRRDWAVRMIKELVLSSGGDPLIAIWGLAYKENTHSIKNSPSIATLKQIPETQVILHDPVVPIEKVDHKRALSASSPIEMLKDAQALMILTPWQNYRDIAPEEIAEAMMGKIVLDPYRVLDSRAAIKAGLQYYTLGMSPDITA